MQCNISSLQITWSARLTSTAGFYQHPRQPFVPGDDEIQLSTKVGCSLIFPSKEFELVVSIRVIDNMLHESKNLNLIYVQVLDTAAKLHNTLRHELCHAAARRVCFLFCSFAYIWRAARVL